MTPFLGYSDGRRSSTNHGSRLRAKSLAVYLTRKECFDFLIFLHVLGVLVRLYQTKYQKSTAKDKEKVAKSYDSFSWIFRRPPIVNQPWIPPPCQKFSGLFDKEGML